MPGVDLLDAFAELVVCVVFNLPHDEPRRPASSDHDDEIPDDDNDCPDGANSSGTTQIFSRVNSLDEEQTSSPLSQPSPPQSHSPSHLHDANAQLIASPNSRESVGGFPPLSGAASRDGRPTLSQGSSLHSLDHYPGGIWNALARVPSLPLPQMHQLQQQQQQYSPVTSTSAALSVASAEATGVPTTPSHPSSIASVNTGDVSTPRSSAAPSTADRTAGLWSRILGGSGVLHTPPRSSSYGQLAATTTTGVSTAASSYVQLNEEDLGMLSASGRVSGCGAFGNYVVNAGSNSSPNNANGNPNTAAFVTTVNAGACASNGNSVWTGYTTPPSGTQYSSPQQFDWAAEDSRGAPGTPSAASTPLCEATPCASTTQAPTQQQQQQLMLNTHGLYVAARRSSSPGVDQQSQASSSSEFIVL